MIELKDIGKNYYLNKTNVINVLKGVNIKFRQHEFVSILGPSGCGKTTLLNVLGGLDVAEKGEIIIDGVSTKQYTACDWDNYRNKRIGFVFQSYNLIPHLNVLNNVGMPLVLAGERKSVCHRRAEEALKRVGLSEQIHKKPSQLSGGQMQRVAIARALVTNPEIILADEPTGALDNEASEQVMDLLKEISKDKLVIMVTHNNLLAEQYSSRIINLSGGIVNGDTNPYDEELSDSIELKPTDTETNLTANTSVVCDTPCDESADIKKKERKKLFHSSHKKQEKSKLGFDTAVSLSAKTLLNKKVRTSLTAFAGSIGIIGIVLVLAFSSGVNAYISNLERGALSIYPLTVSQSGLKMESFLERFATASFSEKEEYPKTEEIYVNKVLGGLLSPEFLLPSKNDLSSFKQYLSENFDDSLGYVKYDYGLKINVYSLDPANSENYMKVSPFTDVMDSKIKNEDVKKLITNYKDVIDQMSTSWTELLNNRDLLSSQYEIIGDGKWPENKIYEKNGVKYVDVVLSVDSSNCLNDYDLLMLGLKSESELLNVFDENKGFSNEIFSVNEIIGKEYKLLTGSDYFEQAESGNLWIQNSSTIQDSDYIESHTAVTARISAVVRPRKGAGGSSITSRIGYPEALTEYLIDYSANSPVALAQKANYRPNTDDYISVTTGKPIWTSEAEKFFSESIGIVDYENPNKILIYANSFENKDKIKDFIKKYNEETGSSLEATDGLQTLIKFVNTMTDAIAKLLIGFCAISLIVSSIMIAVIIYTSVLERRKEVGILRSIGAKKSDITMIFMAESGILGLLSGILGVLVGYILSIPCNVLLESTVGIANLAIVEWWHAVAMISISFTLSVVAGVIPAFIGAKQDPAVALRTE